MRELTSYEIGILRALGDGNWRDRNYLKAIVEHSDYTNLMRPLEADEFVIADPESVVGQRPDRPYRYIITAKGYRALAGAADAQGGYFKD
jgi:hypothetical protein